VRLDLAELMLDNAQYGVFAVAVHHKPQLR
jgi:hypothetical protein